ncbi:MAG TPA: VOC family protein [Trebonia sp.]|jgi:catechol 2,3-dioxygenase-like lactoylglutathione lyase family enzyme|nr:VOC family protein [Trebonia sp.]
MITGAHVILYSQDPDADRAFIRDALGFPHVDAGEGWLIFQLPPSEVALHPLPADGPQFHLMCDDVKATLAALRARGARVTGELAEHRWGIATTLTLPSGTELSLYEPRHPVARGLDG